MKAVGLNEIEKRGEECGMLTATAVMPTKGGQ